MKSEARLDSAVFQLTPTRTRYDLIIIANRKREKIASGLLKPFIAHLKTAQDQIEKGGYSIRLEPDRGTDPLWFTKGTVERFVRFVSTPEVLERVNNLESEILQIEEAIAIQGNDNLSLRTVEDHQSRTRCVEGKKSSYDADVEKGIVLYKPAVSNGSTTQEENSKVQLLKALENRKAVLRQEQGMAFARAVVAGFDMEHMAHLMSFAESFGASRLSEACIRFVGLWKAKHETGHRVETVAAEGITFQSGFSSLKDSAGVLSGDARKQKEFMEAWPTLNGDLGTQNNGKDDKSFPSGPQVPLDPHEYCHGQTENPLLSQWPVHSVPGPPIFQPSLVLGMPCYQNYPGSGSFSLSPHASMGNLGFNTTQRMDLKKHSMDNNDGDAEQKSWGTGSSSIISQNCVGQNVSKEKVNTSEIRQPCIVDIQSTNYITSKRHDASAGQSQSTSDTETEAKSEILPSDAPERLHNHYSRSLNRKRSQTKSLGTPNTHGKNQMVYDQEEDAGNWQAFQKFLLRCKDENRSTIDNSMFLSGEKTPVKRRLTKSEADPIIPLEQDHSGALGMRMVGFDPLNGNACGKKQVASKDELLICNEGRGLIGSQQDTEFKEIQGGKGRFRRTENDGFMMHGPMKKVSNYSSGPPVDHECENAHNFKKGSSYIVTDESFIVPCRSGLDDELVTDKKTVMDMNSDLSSSSQRRKDLSTRTKNQHTYEPHDLSLMPKRGTEKKLVGYDPAKDFDMQVPVRNTIKLETKRQETGSKSNREGLKKLDKERKSRAAQDGSEKWKTDATMRKGKSSKLNPFAEAQARAEKLRAFKADLQKVKKEKEEEERKRLDALKRERQKRIAARSSSNIVQSSLNPQRTKAQMLARRSSSSYRSSKFSDIVPASSPLSKLSARNTSVGPNSSHKVTKSNQLNGGNHLSKNGSRQSVTPLPELKKVTSARTLTRLSPSSYKGSKVSDRVPASPSSPQKLPIRTISIGSRDSIRVSKMDRLNDRSHLLRNGLRQPVVSLPEWKKETAKSQTLTRLSPSSYKGSKFSDALPASSHLQKLTVRSTSVGSNGSHEISKINQIHGGIHLSGNRSRRSVTPLPKLQKESNSLMPEGKAASIQTKRMIDLKSTSSHRASSLRSVVSNQKTKKIITNETHAKKISAMLHLDRSKSAALPELKITTSLGLSDKVQKNSAKNETVHRRTGSRSSVITESIQAMKANEMVLLLSSNDSNPVIEKTVVTFENGMNLGPTIQASEEMTKIGVSSHGDDRSGNLQLMSESAVICASPSPLIVGDPKYPSACGQDKQPSSCEIISCSKEEPKKFKNVFEKPNQAFLARSTSLEGPTTSNRCGQEETVDSIRDSTHMVCSKACVSNLDSNLEQIQEKPPGKELSKGFRKLLKLGRKGQSSASGENNFDGSSVDDCTVSAASNDVPTLEVLMSHDGHPGDTPSKVSHPFSLLSPFRTKTNVKKQAA